MTRLLHADHVVTGFGPDGTPVILDDTAVLIEGETISTIGPADDLARAHPDAERIGGRGRVAIPGLINAHHHVGLTPFQMGARD
ncbi:MAG: amidohydrolase, partial [Pseudomonadota bacterium]